ncbi:MAG: hypothetical protein ACRDGU_04060 [Actinomycetota bacterium]
MQSTRRVAATRGLALVSAGAGAIHLAVIEEHVADSLLFGAFFVVVAAFQLGWAVLMVSRPSRLLCAAGAVANAFVVSIWAVSRSTGLPIGPGAGIPEPVGFIDGVATAYEAVIIGGAMALMQGVPAVPRALRARTRSVLGWGVAGVVGVLAALSLAFPGSSHHQAAHSIAHSHAAMHHHRLHLVALAVAGVVFLAFLALHVFENGWAGFSWRPQPRPSKPASRSPREERAAPPPPEQGRVPR